MSFHALNGDILASLDTLGFEYLRERAFTLFGYKSVFLHLDLMLVVVDITKLLIGSYLFSFL
jgi:hypothetical protein